MHLLAYSAHYKVQLYIHFAGSEVHMNVMASMQRQLLHVSTCP